jgi:hypothetical protein
MKNTTTLFFLIFALLISCKPAFVQTPNVQNNNGKEVDYIPYYLTVYKAKDLYESHKEIECFNVLDDLFKKYDPIETYMVYEMDMYCKLANKLKRYDGLKRIIPIMITKYGRKPYEEKYGDEWQEIIINSGYSKVALMDYYTQYLEKINYALKDSIVEMYHSDQRYRKQVTNETNWAKIDSIDSNNAAVLNKIINKYGYPRESLIGGMEIENPVKPNYMATVLMHVDAEVFLMSLQKALYDEIKNGNCPPYVYASIIDRLKLVGKYNMAGYPYYGTYDNRPVHDTLEANIARESIGLPKLKRVLTN